MWMKVGHLRQVVPSALSFSFELVALGILVEGARTVLNELAHDSGYGVTLWEEKLPVRDVVNGACEILGIDPLYVANEGKLLAIVAPEHADAALEALHNTEGGEASIIGEVREESARMTLMHTGFGGDPLPRIC